MTNKNNNISSRVARIEQDVAWIKDTCNDIKNNHLHTLYDKMDCFEKKLTGRPSWFMTTIVSLLTFLVGALLTCIGVLLK